jgi:serine/threonine-protein kinase SBK
VCSLFVGGVNPDCSPRCSIADNLYQQELTDSYNILKELGSGTYGRVILARCLKTNANVALKVLPKSNAKLKDFLREFNYSYYLSPHASILNTFDVAFETPTSFVFAQEYAQFGDLFEAITPQIGMQEKHAKAMARQVASALDFMHSKGLVHRDVKPENILLFDEHGSKVKLMDFGMTKKVGTLVRKVSQGIPYTPPEICEASKGEKYTVETSADVWAFAVLLFCTLTGNFPWELAHCRDSYFTEFFRWQRRKSSKVPSQWRRFSPRLLRLFRRMLEVKPEKRCDVKEVLKFLDDDWVIAGPPVDNAVHKLKNGNDENDNPMAELNAVLEKHGIETKINKRMRERRISEWIMSASCA